MNIVEQKWKFLNSTLVVVPKKVSGLYKFGLKIFPFRKVESLRSNSRLLSLTWNTAKSKVYRITANKKLGALFPKLLKVLRIVRERDIIAIDFSDFNGFQVLMFAKQTKKGRAIPVYFEILVYPIKKDSQNLFVINAIKNFENLIGFKLKLVFDRGFACPSIVEYLDKNGWRFIIRIKKCKLVVFQKTKEKFKVVDSPEQDVKVIAYNRKLRVIISKKTEETQEPWYLVTNDFRSSREQIIKTYYYRFEIEEFFRDAKRLLGLEYIDFKKTRSLATTLWFVILGYWCLWFIREKERDEEQRNKMQLSRIRYFFEKFNSEIIQLAESTFYG